MYRVTFAVVLISSFFSAAPASSEEPSGLKVIEKKIAKIRAEKLAWREVNWLNCPLEAIERSKKEKKPIITWVFLGNPNDERC